MWTSVLSSIKWRLNSLLFPDSQQSEGVSATGWGNVGAILELRVPPSLLTHDSSADEAEMLGYKDKNHNSTTL